MLMTRIIIGIFIGLLSVSSVSVSVAAPSQMHDTSRRLYNRVMEEFKQRDYEAALAGFRLFIELHGQSSLAANAQYWIGECQFRMRRYVDALDSFYNVLMNYPLSPKLPASTLKLAQTYTKLGDHEKARTMFGRVLDQFPDSSEADIARKAIESTGGRDDQDSTQSE
jgi:tol-pal system protein YbgF